MPSKLLFDAFTRLKAWINIHKMSNRVPPTSYLTYDSIMARPILHQNGRQSPISHLPILMQGRCERSDDRGHNAGLLWLSRIYSLLTAPLGVRNCPLRWCSLATIDRPGQSRLAWAITRGGQTGVHGLVFTGVHRLVFRGRRNGLSEWSASTASHSTLRGTRLNPTGATKLQNCCKLLAYVPKRCGFAITDRNTILARLTQLKCCRLTYATCTSTLPVYLNDVCGNET